MFAVQKDLAVFLALLFRLIALPVIILLFVYNLRRLLFSFTTIFSGKTTSHLVSQPEGQKTIPDVLILAPCRDEEKMIPGLCQALARLNYPSDQVCVVLVDDNSQDHTRLVMEEYAQSKPGWHVLSIQKSEGKASALNTALADFSFGDIILVYDADHRPEADSLRRIVEYFQDMRVAGVSGRTVPANPLASPSTYYATVESYIHQMVTMRAKDRLDLAPALLGSNCAYRRTCLDACGGFRRGALLEDSDLTLAFYRAGFRIRFAEYAVAYHQVPETVRGYLKQHMRWGRGFNDVSQNYGLALLREKRLPVRQRIELFLFTTGYLDRIALAGAGLLSVLSLLLHPYFQFPYWVLYIALITPFIQIVAMFIEQRAPVAFWRRFPWVPVFFLLDIYAALRSMADSLMNRPRVWAKTERVNAGDGI